jgi:predicted enzyme related to lactoylglutathione lyase
MGAAMNLTQVTVGFTDYAASVAFYELLGLTQIVDSPPRYARFECPGGATVSLHHSEHPISRATVVYFETEELDAEVARLQAAGVAFLSGPRDEPWLWREARLLDPGGNEICLFRAGPNRRFPPWRLASGDAG